MKYIFIVNPESAKGNAMKIIGNIEKVCKQEHIEYEVCYTLAQGDATRLAQSYKDEENIIYAVGGDGTLSEVLNGVVGTKNKIGIIPAGSGNDFYRTVKELGKTEIESDVGVVNGKYFLNIACVGIDAEVANNVPLMKKKNIKVKNLYTASILYTFTHFKFKQIHFKPQEKDEIMKKFKEGEIDILVSTTVIEVGVNVPNANIMVVENADRFGLAQLHQLRGRVGRGQYQSYCVLKYNSKCSQVGKERMKTMQETNDGFVIAEKDLELRGTGEFFGTKQHGIPEFKIANLFVDMPMLKSVQSVALKIESEDKGLTQQKNERLRKIVDNKLKQSVSL